MEFDVGTRLLLLVGKRIPLPAMFGVVDALRSAEIRTSAKGGDGFQLTFSMGRDTPLGSKLLTLRIFEPLNRVIVVILHRGMPHVLMDGLVTDHQVVPSNRPGESQLTVSGQGLELHLDLHHETKGWKGQSNSGIVQQILLRYAVHGIVPVVTPTLDFSVETLLVPSQQESDLAFVRELAKEHGFAFYLEPTRIPGKVRAYWGPPIRAGLPQRALSMNMGPFTNVDQPMHFRYDAMRPLAPEVAVVDPVFGLQIPIVLPDLTLVPLALEPAIAHRTQTLRNTAGATVLQAIARGIATMASGEEPVTATGEVDLVRYGAILKPRGLVGVRGVGFDYDGYWYTREVNYSIERGSFKQSFTLTREGRGSLTPLVVP